MPNCQFASYRLLDCEFVINSVSMHIDVCLEKNLLMILCALHKAVSSE